MANILAINGSYRDDGITDRTVDIMVDALRDAGNEVELILLREYPIEFCLNCRECTQQAGSEPGICVQHDGMHALVDKIENADAFILASPTNFSSVTAIFKRFMERLVVYGYWPWGKHAPKFRKYSNLGKKAIIVSSSAAPGLLGRIFYSSHRQLKMTAKVIGAKTVGKIFIGMISDEPHPALPDKIRNRAISLASRLQ